MASPWGRSVAVEIEPLAAGLPARVESAVAEQSVRVAPLVDELEAMLRSGLARPYPAAETLVRLVEVAGDARGEAGGVLDLEALTVACRKALVEAQPRLMEPLMSFEIACPAATLSGVLADLRSRSAEIEHVESQPGGCAVAGAVRLANVLGYATRLRSLTRGLGTLQLTLRGYVVAADDQGG